MKKLLVLTLLTCALGWAADKKIVIGGSSSWWVYEDEAIADFRKAAGNRADVVIARTPDALAAEIAEAHGVIGSVSKDLFAQAKKLEWVQTTSAGVEAYTFWPEFVSSDVTLTNCKIVQGPTIADHAMAMLLALTRGMTGYIAKREKQEWKRSREDTAHLTELADMTAVVIGVGGIGTQIAQRAHAFGMTVIGVDPKDIPPQPAVQRIVPPDRLDEVLPVADVVFVAAPHTPQTERMIGSRQFDLMKRGAYFIVVSRGKLYDKRALVKALDSKKLAGAGLDVTDPEPLPKGDSLWEFDNVIITPHIASQALGSNRRRVAVITENIRRFAHGERLINVVGKRRGY